MTTQHPSLYPDAAKRAVVSESSDWAAWLDSYEGLPVPVRPAKEQPPTPLLHAWLDRAGVVAPGLLLAAFLALCAHFLADWIGRYILGFQKSPIGSIAVAVVLGAILRNAAGVPLQYEAGLKTCVRFVLRAGIVLLGLRLSLPLVGVIGLAGLPIIVCCIVTALVVVGALSRALGLSSKQGLLIAIGTSICGVSAIAAAAPVIGAEEDEVSYSIACVTLFGMLAMFAYPFFAFWVFAGNNQLAGYLLGTAIHDTAQVTGAAMMYRQQFHAPEALDVATVTKLLRNTTMIVLIPLMGFLAHRGTAAQRKGSFRISQAVPFFVIGYLILAGVRSIGDLGTKPFLILERSSWTSLISQADTASGWFLATAMAAVGLGTQFARIRKLGWRPMAAGLAAALIVGAVSLSLLKLFPPTL